MVRGMEGLSLLEAGACASMQISQEFFSNIYVRVCYCTCPGMQIQSKVECVIIETGNEVSETL